MVEIELARRGHLSADAESAAFVFIDHPIRGANRTVNLRTDALIRPAFARVHDLGVRAIGETLVVHRFAPFDAYRLLQSGAFTIVLGLLDASPLHARFALLAQRRFVLVFILHARRTRQRERDHHT